MIGCAILGETGLVTALSADESKITVTFRRGEACEKCRACLAGPAGSEEMLMEAKNLCGANIGDTVEIELRDGYFFKAALITYGIPLFALFAGISLGMLFFDEIWAFASGIALMLLSYAVIKFSGERFTKSGFVPMAIAVVSDNQKGPENEKN